MNIVFNQRYQTTEEKIKKALFSLLDFRKYNDIAIKEICYEAGINRSSFYAHYQDINDLMIKTEKRLSKNIQEIFSSKDGWGKREFVKLFEFLYENRVFYKAYLSTNEQTFMEKNDFIYYIDAVKNIENKYASSDVVYHMAFFAGGLKAISKSWIIRGCKETPEQMAQVLYDEYSKKII